MSAAATTGAATIARLDCRYALPREGFEETTLRARLDRVLGERLPRAVGVALGPLEDVDEGAVWVVRTLRADAVISATLEDLDGLARQWGGQLGEAVLATLRAGPSGNVVRFASRAQHLAAFAAALASGIADSWPFAPLAGLRMLRPGAAIRTGAASAGVQVTAVLAELAAGPGLGTVLAGATAEETTALWTACVSECASLAPAPGQVAHVLAAARELEALVPTAHAPELAIRLLTSLSPTLGDGPEMVATIDAVVMGGRGLPGLADESDAGAEAGTQDAARATLERASRRMTMAGTKRAPATSHTAAPQAGVFAADGVQAFLLLPALERLGLSAISSGARARVLARALGLEPDAAILLAAGVPEDTPPERDAALRTVLATLLADDRIDGRWLATEAVAHPDRRRRIALVRDLATDTWLAGALTGEHRAPPWEALLDSAIAATGRRPDVVLGEGSPVETVDPSPACAAALRELRPAHADAALLASAHDQDLADGLAARAVIRELASRLPGFGRSTWAYVVERFLPPRGIVATAPEQIHAELPAAALAIVLVMAGLDTFSFRVPWLEQEVLVSHRGD
jgi:hypothetical protein